MGWGTALPSTEAEPSETGQHVHSSWRENGSVGLVGVGCQGARGGGMGVPGESSPRPSWGVDHGTGEGEAPGPARLGGAFWTLPSPALLWFSLTTKIVQGSQ